MVEGAYSVFPGQQRPKCISFTLDSPIQNRGLCVPYGWGKMGHVLNCVISHLEGICFKKIYGLVRAIQLVLNAGRLMEMIQKGPEKHGLKIMSITLIATDTVKHYNDIGVHILSLFYQIKYKL